MHEWKTAQAIANKVLDLSDDGRVTSIRVRLGPQSHIDETTLTSHLSMLTEGTAAASANVVVVAALPEDDATDVVLESIEVES